MFKRSPDKPLHIDIPVKLSDVKAVFSVDALAFEGDLPASIFHMQLIKNDIAGRSASSETVAVFRTNAGHVTLHDTAYNADRQHRDGKPLQGSHFRSAEARGEGRAVRRNCKGPRLGKRGPAGADKGQYRCHGENDTARPTGIREDHRVRRSPITIRTQIANLWRPIRCNN